MMDSILYSAPIKQAMVGGNWEDRGTGKVNRCDVLSVPWKWLFSDPIVGFAYNVENGFSSRQLIQDGYIYLPKLTENLL
ncbi:hypothetical protein MRB53_008842 [Persea americana]|uniref:Uncharacterized protein n=1 Tax=Persea americana TaxID=3435 RepID=A0ACC2LMA4_PERAE|nr:hypothetical protein MRB53_008842 [Persea americana]